MAFLLHLKGDSHVQGMGSSSTCLSLRPLAHTIRHNKHPTALPTSRSKQPRSTFSTSLATPTATHGYRPIENPPPRKPNQLRSLHPIDRPTLIHSCHHGAIPAASFSHSSGVAASRSHDPRGQTGRGIRPSFAVLLRPSQQPINLGRDHYPNAQMIHDFEAPKASNVLRQSSDYQISGLSA